MALGRGGRKTKVGEPQTEVIFRERVGSACCEVGRFSQMS